jgi:broad specificity phosphatase PhoE
MQLTLIRHGPTDWNATRRFQGRTDLPLSERGRAHARAIAAALRSEPIERIYSSDLMRAMETARFVAERSGVEVIADERLREFDFGAWEGLTWDEIVAANPGMAGLGSTAAKRYAPEGGESFEQVCARVESFLNDLANQPVERAVVVTHAGPLHAIFAVLQIERAATPADNLSLNFTPGGVTRIELESGKASVIALNDLRHLDGER